MIQFQGTTFEGGNENLRFDKHPNECPHCHRSITPRIFQGFRFNSQLGIIYQCPDSNCREIFIAYYNQRHNGGNMFFEFTHTSIGKVKGKKFSDNILGISSAFVDIYNQSVKAEELGLAHICGIGYRKALEFLIKDYLITLKPDKEDEIKKKFLGKCIKDFVENPNLKNMAERAAWLGNDETHYSRKWDDKDINDLKILIDVSVHWIEMELLTKKYKEEMK